MVPHGLGKAEVTGDRVVAVPMPLVRAVLEPALQGKVITAVKALVTGILVT
jgi:hypothetical protein